MGTRPLVNESLAEYRRGVVDYLSRLEAAQFLVTAMRREERMIVRHLIPFHKSYLSDLPYPSDLYPCPTRPTRPAHLTSSDWSYLSDWSDRRLS